MNSSSGDDEAPKDPRTGGEDFTQQFTENDFEGKSRRRERENCECS